MQSTSASNTSSVASNVPFAEFCGLIERVSRARGTENKRSLLRRFIQEWRDTHSRLHGASAAVNTDNKDSFFGAMRLLLPTCDKSRSAYGIKEHSLAKLYTEILCLGAHSGDALKLLNYKQPKHAHASAGDFAEVAYTVLKNRCPERGALTVQDINDNLTGIAQGHASKKKDQVKRCLLHLLKNTSALEQKWLIRVIMKELKCGLSQISVLTTFHPDAESLYDVSQDLEKVCFQLHDPTKRLTEIAISLFSPFRPMLADRGNPSTIDRQVGNTDFLMEVKLDGERMQLHKDGDHYRFWSRNGLEWTATFGNSPHNGNLTRYLHPCFGRHVRNCILDGEMMGYNQATQTMGSKAEEFDIKRPGTVVTRSYEPCFIVFDLVLLNDEVLTGRPALERKKLLDALFEPIEGRFMLSQWQEAKTKEQCIEFFNNAIDNREEGIMVKSAKSAYTVATRKGGWFKLKPDYVIGLMDDLDLLIVGGYFGTGNRAKMIAQFLCAVAVPSDIPGEHPSVFLSFCRVGTGYSKQQLYEYCQRMSKHWKPYNKAKPPAFLQLGGNFKERPDVYVEPALSLLVQVKAAEITKSESYKTGCTLRFPRAECFRDDKAWHECMTMPELQELRVAHEGKLGSRHVQLSDGEMSGEESVSPAKKRRVVRTSAAVKPTVMTQFRAGVDVSKVSTLSTLFADKEFCVITKGTALKTELERKIVECSGRIVQNPGKETFCVIADHVNLKVSNLIRSSNYNIAQSDWLLRCVEEGQLLPWRPLDLIHASRATVKAMSADFDKFGDSYTEDVSADDLKTLFLRLDEKKTVLPNISPLDRCDLVAECWPDDAECTFGFLSGLRVHFVDQLISGQADTRLSNSASGGLTELAADLVRFGGQLESDPAMDHVSHVVMSTVFPDSSRLTELRNLNRSRSRRFHLVNPDWLKHCITQERILNERPYHL